MRLACLAFALGCGHAAPPPANVTPVAPVTANRCGPPSPAIGKLVALIDADADELHNDYTPAVFQLIAAGRPGACAVADLLTAESSQTRLHAERVFEGVLAGEQGFVSGRGFHDEYGEQTTRQITAAIGYDYNAPTAKSAAAWRYWLQLPSRTVVDGPTREAMKTALDAVGSKLHACGEPALVTVSFDHSGRVSAIFNEAITDATYRACLTAATTAIQLPPFHRASVWTKWP